MVKGLKMAGIHPSRPSIELPSCSSTDSFFQGFPSPGPLTFTSSLFAEHDQEAESKSFSQLLCTAMTTTKEDNGESGFQMNQSGQWTSEIPPSPVFIVPPGLSPSALLNSPQNLFTVPSNDTIPQSPLFTIPPGLSPSALLGSPRYFSPGQGPCMMTHQEALAHVTAQAIESKYPLLSSKEVEEQCSKAIKHEPLSILDSKDVISEQEDVFSSDATSHPVILHKSLRDGYKWRKYGRKKVKGHLRSYYRCCHLSCTVRKKVEYASDGQITQIIYESSHNHQNPQDKTSKDCISVPYGSIKLDADEDSNQEKTIQDDALCNGRLNSITTTQSLDINNEEEGNDFERRDGNIGNEPYSNRREKDYSGNASASSVQSSSERIVLQTTSEVDILDDGYKWRKYGQKVVKGNSQPRSYYRCTNPGCGIRKHIERLPDNPKVVMTTYEGKHNHSVPNTKNASMNLTAKG